MSTQQSNSRGEQLKMPWWHERPNEFEGLADHLATKLMNGGISTVEDLRNAGEQRVREMDGIGRKGLEDIKAYLRSLDQA